MNGLLQADKEVAEKLDHTLTSIPASFNKDGSFRKNASVATREQFALLNQFVKKKIAGIQEEILNGEAQVSPYELGKKDACEYCAFQTVCGYEDVYKRQGGIPPFAEGLSGKEKAEI